VRVSRGMILTLVTAMMIMTLISLTGHVEHPDDGVGVGPVGARRHESLISVVVGHRADGEGLLHVKVQLVPLLDQVVVVGGSVVVPRAVIVISDVVRVFIIRTFGTSHTLPVDVVNDVSVGL